MSETSGQGSPDVGCTQHNNGNDLAWQALKWLGLCLAALVGMDQIGFIIQETIPTDALSVTWLYAPGQVLSGWGATSEALKLWADASLQFGQLWVWLYLHLLFDLGFITGYGKLGLVLLPPKEKVTRRILWALVVADVVEDLLAALAFTRIIHHQLPVAAFTDFLHAATVGKWLIALVFLIRLGFWSWDHARGPIGRALWALWEQRFSVIIVAFLGVLAIGHGPDVLEQMPDVERSWLTAVGLGWVHAGIAVIAQVLLAVLLLFLGRMRTLRAEEKASGVDKRDEPSYVPWILFPAVLLALALALGLSGAAEIDRGRLIVTVAAPVAVAGISRIMKWRHWGSDMPPPHPAPGPVGAAPEPNETSRMTEAGKAARTAGDVLAVAVLALTGLGLVRSFTALAILGYGGRGVTAASWTAVALGIVIVTGVWPLANRPVRRGLRKLADSSGWAARFANWARRNWTRTRKTGRTERTGQEPSWWPWLAAGAPFLTATAALLFAPLWATHWLGVLGTTVIAAGTLAVFLAVLAYQAQIRKPLPLFRVLRLNVTPVLTLIAIIALVGANVDSSSALHDIRGPVPAKQPPDQQSLLTSLDKWLDNSTATCAVPAAGAATAGPQLRIRPLILVAAAGGGIRAAWWTEDALADVAATPCGPDDVFAVSSVSGGSLGMAVLDSAPTIQDADADMASIAGPDALGAGIDGLLLHDTLAGFTGLDLPAAQMPGGQPFSDRADLIESAWQRQDANLAQAFPVRKPALPWRLLFNSTDANSGCRAIIADRPLTAASGTPDPGSNLTCDLRSPVPGSDSFDFFAKLPCTQNIALVTAAMLSARFPYITPSGTVPSCSDKNVLAGQFVDGGYADSSGLLTLADLIPSLTAEVRARNALNVAHASPGQPVTLVVPIVMYLGNSPRPDPVDAAASRIQESVIPPDAKSAASAQLSTSDTMLQRIQGMLGTSQWLQCDPARPECAAVESAAADHHAVPYQVIFVSPRTEPRISAPLGWVLSTASRDALTTALGEEEQPSSQCTNTPQPGVCQPGIGRIADLLHFIQNG
jgi:hypothetical protein